MRLCLFIHACIHVQTGTSHLYTETYRSNLENVPFDFLGNSLYPVKKLDSFLGKHDPVYLHVFYL